MYKWKPENLYCVEGKPMSLRELMSIAKENGSKISRSGMRNRIKNGDSSLISIIRDPGRDVSAASSARKRKKDEAKEEMAAVIANLGPRRRY